MTKRISSFFLTISILLASFSTLSAQTTGRAGSWDTLNSYLNSEIVVKADGRNTVIGTLTSVNANEMTVRTSNQNTATDVVFRREQVDKIWLANQNASSGNTLIGVGVGAAVGAGIGAAALLSNRDDGGGAYGAAIPLYAAAGALVGGLAGFFVRTNKKKGRLIYQK